MNTYDQIAANKSFSGVDMVAQALMTDANGNRHIYILGSLQTLTYSIHMERRPIRSIGNINAKDYVQGPRTIAGTLIFTVFNKHFAYEAMDAIKQNTAQAFLADELPPFDVTVSFANEYGAQARMVLYGIRLINEGQVMSINDIYTENTYQYVATDIEYISDASGYSTTSTNNVDRYVDSTATQADLTSGSYIKSIATSQASTDDATDIGLSVMSVYPATSTKKGTVRMTLSPAQTEGVIKVNADGLSMEFDVSEYQGLPIYVSLGAGKYTAQFVGKYKSNARSFTVSQLAVSDNADKAAPVIEWTSRNQIYVGSNVSSHYAVRYAEVTGEPGLEFQEMNLIKGFALLSNLKEDTQYMVYTIGKDDQSLAVYVRTQAYNTAPYDKLKEYVTYNGSQLTSGTLSEYIALIDQAMAISEASTTSMTVLDAVNKLISTLQTQRNAMSRSQYDSDSAYAAAYEEISKKISIMGQVLIFAIRYTNNVTIGTNTATKVKPPKPQLSDAANCVFIIDSSIERLEFYRQYSGIAQFAIEVKKVAFTKNSSGQLTYQFNGKPGLNHYVYAYNKAGQRSVKLSFYVMTDAERAVALNQYYTDHATATELLTAASNQHGAALKKLGLSDVIYNRALAQFAKQSSTNIFMMPVITTWTSDSITVSVNPNGRFDSGGGAWMTLAPLDEALISAPRQKIRLTRYITSVQFTAAAHGLQADESYVIWIENDSGNQISPCTSITLYASETDDEVDQEEQLKLYISSIIMSKIRYALSSMITITNEIDSCIDQLCSDDTLTYDNAFARLIQNVLSYTPKISNAYSIIRAIIKAKMQIVYSVDTLFYDDNKVTYNSSLSFEFPARSEDYMIVIESVLDGVTSVTTIAIGSGTKAKVDIPYGKSYACMYGLSHDLKTVSGAVLVDTFTRLVDFYKINV